MARVNARRIIFSGAVKKQAGTLNAWRFLIIDRLDAVALGPLATGAELLTAERG